METKPENNLPHAHRKFYDLPTRAPDGPRTRAEDGAADPCATAEGAARPAEPAAGEAASPLDSACTEPLAQTPADLCQYIAESVVGKDKVFSAPFGLRKVVYCDFTASGRSLSFLEDYIRQEVLPEYGNTHTTTTVSALQTTLFRNESRDIVRNAVHASEHDAVIFVGSGCTAAVHKVIHSLHFTHPPVVFVGPFEHHSNLLPWREAGALVIRISETRDGLVNLKHLTQELQQWQGQDRQLVGCFSAASNITGVLTDVDAITILLHRYNCLAFWDYATAGAYVKIDMNPVADNSEDQPYVYKDAIFLSPHKFVGGVQTPGLLVAKKSIFKNPVPSNCGGGSVFFVRRSSHRYLQEAEMREEGGTPAIVESIRAGLVFQLKEAVGVDTIMEKEHQLTEYALSEWSGVSGLVLLGPTSVPRLSIFSFLVRHHQSQRFLHYNFVCAVLNDVFGIQARGGCACAGPYAEDLLGIDEQLAEEIENVLVEDSRLDRVHLRRYREYSEREILRPGFIRLNLPYFADQETVEFVVKAVKLVAQHAWKLLPQYTFNPETGEWRHRQHQVFRDRKWLGFISYKTASMVYHQPPCPNKGPLPQSYQECLQMAELLFHQAEKVRVHIADQTLLFGDEAERLRWFLLPSEALHCLQQPGNGSGQMKTTVPFEPLVYPRTAGSSYQLSNTLHSVSHNVLHRTDLKDVPLQKETSKTPCQSRETASCHENYSLQNVSSIERSVTTVAAGLMADSLRTALKEVHQGESSMEGKHPEGFQEDKLEGHVNGTPGSSVTQEGDDLNVLNGKVTRPTQTRESNGTGYGIQNNLLDTVTLAASGERLEMTAESGDGQKSNLMCLDGACFKKRETRTTGSAVPTPPGGKHRWHPPNKKIFNPTVEALEEFSMIEDGDRVLVCLSGGKDSLSLLHTLRQYQFYAKKKGVIFELGAVTVDPMTSSYDPSPLKGYLVQLGVPYFYEEQAILEAAAELPYECTSICSFCSRMKRGRIYHAARREKYNVLAMGQHLDDLAESFLMSVFHNGLLRTMKASYSVRERDLRVIRPFVYVREKDLREFAAQKNLPVIAENCPACFEAPKERHRMKQLLASQEVIFPRLFHSIAAAIKPVMAINKTGINVPKLLMTNSLLEKDHTPNDDEEEELEDF